MTLLLADAYLHTVDPFAIRLTETFGLRWYGLSYLAGFAIAWLLILWMAKTRRALLDPKYVADLLFYAIVGILLGGRLGYVFFYDPRLLLDFSAQFPWWGVLAITRGGMASHGGMIGAMIALILYARRYNVPTLHVFDLGAIAATPGLFLGRIANFINGELIGRAVRDQEHPPWWSMKFPQEMRQWEVNKLVELRPIVEHAGVERFEWDAALTQIAAHDPPPRDALDLVYRTIERIIDSAQQGNEAVIEHLRSVLTAVYPSQLMQALTDGPILFAVLALVWLRPRKPGVVASWFLIAYGVLRIATEMFRQPDAMLAAGVTRGQSLSVFMIFGGVALLIWCTRSGARPVGGLAGKQSTSLAS